MLLPPKFATHLKPSARQDVRKINFRDTQNRFLGFSVSLEFEFHREYLRPVKEEKISIFINKIVFGSVLNSLNLYGEISTRVAFETNFKSKQRVEKTQIHSLL